MCFSEAQQPATISVARSTLTRAKLQSQALSHKTTTDRQLSKMYKPYDVVVYGASGFTGRLILRYLLDCPSSSTTKIAAAGRSEEKIKGVLKDLGHPETPILLADAHDEGALKQVAQQTKVIIATAGPFALYGSTIVKVCSEIGTDCIDLTGEPHWSREMITKHDAAARASKAILIHGAGVDSVPSDLTTYLAVKKLREETSASCGMVTAGWRWKGAASGGSFASLLEGCEQASKKAEQMLVEPYALSPIKGKQQPETLLSMSEGNRVGGFFIMEPANAPVVRQTWGILEKHASNNHGAFTYGPDFAFREFLEMPNRILASLWSIAFYGFLLALTKFSFLRSLGRRFGPQPGDGPSESFQKSGWFRTLTTARSIDGKIFTQCTMKGKGDPGYLATSVIISEVALSLCEDRDRLTDIAKEGGHLTPATVFGEILKERLEKTGRFTFKTEKVDKPQ